MNDSWAIQTEHLTRYFGQNPAVYDLNLKVRKGTVLGFLGRNGSGKTTTIRMLLGLLLPTRGRSFILGEPSLHIPPKLRAKIGYMTESHALYDSMTVKECGRFQAAFYPNWNEKIFQSIVGHFGLQPNARARDLSRGELAGLSLALTLAPDPELIILDDPAIGLDPVARASLVESMIHLTRQKNRTIFFSSHHLSDVERVADEISILDRSVLRASCSLSTFQQRVRRVTLHFPGDSPKVPNIPGILNSIRRPGQLSLVCANYGEETHQKLELLQPQSIDVCSVSLEEAVVGYMGERGEKNKLLNAWEDNE